MGVVRQLSDYRQQERHIVTPEAAGKGFALMHRQFMDSKLYKDSQAVHLWLHCIMKANYEAKEVNTDIGSMVVGRGQFITGRPTLVTETGISDNKVKSLLDTFARMGMITRESFGRNFTRITVTKYDDFQSNFNPTEIQEKSNGKPHDSRLGAGVNPTEIQRKSITKELNNNSLGKPNECATGDENTELEKPTPVMQRLSCDEVWQCLKDELPEARGWKTLTDDRRNLIRNFWGKANKIARSLDGKPLDIAGFRGYLKYISDNCRWMLEDRPDQKTGKTWRRMKFDSFLSPKLYVEVREGDKDDR